MRFIFGGDNLGLAANLTGIACSGEFDGVRYTDLLPVARGNPNPVATDQNGTLLSFYGPDEVATVWVDFGNGAPRLRLNAQRPAADKAPVGRQFYDLALGRWLWSDGQLWRGTAASADTSALCRLADLASSDRQRSVARLRRDRDDATTFIEAWATLGAWSPSVNNSVSAGKVYSLGGPSNPTGGTHAISVPKYSRFRTTGTLNFVAGGTNYALIGLTKTAGALAAGMTNTIAWGLLGSTPSRWMNAATTGHTSGTLTAVGGSVASASTGSYTLTITGDESGICVSLVNATHSVEWTDYVPWVDVSADFVSVMFWVSDTRALAGSSIGRLAVTTSANTIVPRTGVEGLGDAVVTAVDAAGNLMRVCLPKAYDSRVPSPVVIYHHGGYEDSTGPFTDTNKRAMIQALVDAGFVVASTDAGMGSWANNAGIAGYVNLYRYVRDHFAIGPVHHLGQSMGGLTATLNLASHGIPAASVALIYPVTSLASMYYPPTFTTLIDTAYGIPGAGTYAALTAGHDPNLLDGSAVAGVPIWGIASYGDVTADRTLNLDVFAAKVALGAPEVTILTATGLHGDPSHFNATATTSLLAFLNRHSLASGA